MTTRMLIDARHREETRVAVVKGTQIDEFDFESTEHKQLKGNIYLAKVTRVEPSLQAAFIEYGGNRHGFLAFSEIHPDYYQIPREDRERLLAEEAEVAAEEAALREQEEADEDYPAGIMRSDAHDEEGSDLIEVDTDTAVDTIDFSQGDDGDHDDDDHADDGHSDDAHDDHEGDEHASDEHEASHAENGEQDEDGEGERSDEAAPRGRRRGRGRSGGRDGGRDGGREGGRSGGRPAVAKASDEARAKRMNLRRRYKIQDVVHRRQVLLVQVVKEERGNKGAALTTYLSLAGRYCVLMPNTSHGGGISRKISSASDRKRLKEIVSDLALPATMGCIVRTAGLSRTKPEIKRDFDYLARLWDEIRENTLGSAAPALIHSDSDLVKRAIRDIYNRDIDEVIVEGEAGFRAAKDFMRLLMPSHAKRVKQYADPVPLFQRHGVEDQLSAMYNPVVQLKSGGYIVINPTEALVSIDINSGRSTKEHGIEATALSTNLEAAREIARQLRLRDMAGLVVIDFIDMEHHGNGRKVERAMKDALKNDRARIQVGRISSFGLMEMSRQRLRTGVLEASTRSCPHCEGTGLVRTASSAGLSALRLIEEEAARGRGTEITLYASQEATIYVLNAKRFELAEIERMYGVSVAIVPNGEIEGAKMTVGSAGPKPERAVQFVPLVEAYDEDDDIPDDEDDVEVEAEHAPEREPRRERGGRGRGRDGERDRPRREEVQADTSQSDDDNSEGEREVRPGEPRNDDNGLDSEGRPRRKRRRRGRRGGRGRQEGEGQAEGVGQQDGEGNDAHDGEAAHEDVGEQLGDAAATDEPVAEAPPKRVRRGRGKAAAAQDAAVAEAPADAAPAEAEAPTAPAKRGRRAAKPAVADEALAAAPAADVTADGDTPAAKPARARRKKSAPEEAVVLPEAMAKEDPADAKLEADAPKPRRSRAKATPTADASDDAAPAKPARGAAKDVAEDSVSREADASAAPSSDGSDAPSNDSGDRSAGGSRKGWWQRTFG